MVFSSSAELTISSSEIVSTSVASTMTSFFFASTGFSFLMGLEGGLKLSSSGVVGDDSVPGVLVGDVERLEGVLGVLEVGGAISAMCSSGIGDVAADFAFAPFVFGGSSIISCPRRSSARTWTVVRPAPWEFTNSLPFTSMSLPWKIFSFMSVGGKLHSQLLLRLDHQVSRWPNCSGVSLMASLGHIGQAQSTSTACCPQRILVAALAARFVGSHTWPSRLAGIGVCGRGNRFHVVQRPGLAAVADVEPSC